MSTIFQAVNHEALLLVGYIVYESGSEVTAQDYKLILLGLIPSSVCGSQWNKEYYSNSKLPKALRTETKQGTQNCRALGIGEKTHFSSPLLLCKPQSGNAG